MQQGPEDLERAWRQVVEDVAPEKQAWLRSSALATVHENTAIIEVPNEFTRTRLEGRQRGQLEDALTELLGREMRIAVTVNPALERTDADVATESGPGSRGVEHAARRDPRDRDHDDDESMRRPIDMSTYRSAGARGL